ncbi:putative ankyrin repeat protein [Botrytis fragariae]|uniref:Putative ankyrin repeat protein n=1 Tax=Botrytis fragariae TaxID=1964551 RepID=A0A8H6EIX8_9HELO|nr:putative ankyrin repeat protein [Botrytis fragariae]KAF5873600.1 putative ankyrin repeat protein [Botrytis fragariae]
MSSSPAFNESFKHRFRKGLNRLRRKSRDSSKDANINSTPRIPINSNTLATNTYSSLERLTSQASSNSLSQAHDLSKELPTTRDNTVQTQIDQSTALPRIHLSGIEDDSSSNHLTPSVEIDLAVVSLDVWSAAYREAVNSLGKDINLAILKGENLAELFKQLETIDKEVTQESLFLRGVKYLHSLQVPLDSFKLALDLASPLTSIEPTTSMVFGIIKGVTAIAISISNADLNFAKQIGQMLEQLSYIDDCDTLGQKTKKIDIHKVVCCMPFESLFNSLQALVLVYQKLLEFYITAFEILTRKGAKLVMRLILKDSHLPDIVKDFLDHADNLRKLVQKATWEIVEDIKIMLYDYEIARWLGSEKMSRQNQYHVSLQEIRVDEACEFLLEDTKFIDWHHATDSQQLVILGDMGCGKSVAMAYLIDELRRQNEHQLPQPKICYHYCRDDETGQAICIFSVLILSLLGQLSGLKRTFFEWYKQGAASGIELATNSKQLIEWLLKALETLDRPLFLVIDGLDECDRASRRILLKSLRDLSQKTPRLKVLLSSRPEEEILQLLSGMAKINLNSDTERDRIIVEKTVERQLSYLSKPVKVFISQSLSRLAQGSAIWTKMTIELIEIRGIRALGPMRAFLEETPQPKQLSKLYANLLSRYTFKDPENQKLAIVALEILAITRRPLSILELAWAVLVDTYEEKDISMDVLSELVDHQRVIGLIQPFIAQIDFSDVRKHQVRLVHQSVKEFIFKELAPDSPGPGNLAISTQGEIDQVFIQQRTESLEAGIMNMCIKYLLLEHVGNADLFSEEQVAIEELPQDFNLLLDDNDESKDYDPYCTWETWEENMIHYLPTERGFGELFVYASCHWIEHFSAVSTESLLPSLESIENLCQAGSTRLHNWITQNCRPKCTIKPRFVFDSSLYDPLSITSLYGSEDMLRIMLESSDFQKIKFLPNPAIGAAEQILQWGDLSRLRLLMRSKIGYQLRNLDFFLLVMKQWSSRMAHNKSRKGWDVVFDLIDDVSDIMVEERWGDELFRMAVSIGCMPMIQRLLDRAYRTVELRSKLFNRRETQHQLIAEAVVGNHVDVLEYLLTQHDIEAHLHYQNSHGENVLHLASRFCNPAIFRSLVPRCKDIVCQTDDQNNTVLMRIIMSPSTAQNRSESARILLSESGAYERGTFRDGQQEYLREAIRLGDIDMCHTLIRVGKMNPLLTAIHDDDDQMILKDKTSENEQGISTMLKLLCAHSDEGLT